MSFTLIWLALEMRVVSVYVYHSSTFRHLFYGVYKLFHFIQSCRRWFQLTIYVLFIIMCLDALYSVNYTQIVSFCCRKCVRCYFDFFSIKWIWLFATISRCCFNKVCKRIYVRANLYWKASGKYIRSVDFSSISDQLTIG